MRPHTSMSREEARAYDRDAMGRGIPGLVLMENAARGVVELLTGLGAYGPIGIVCGKGNNAGDGFAIARLLAGLGFGVSVELLCDPSEFTGDAAGAYAPLTSLPIEIARFDDQCGARLRRRQWLVDALLGTGARGAVRAPFGAAIEALGSAGRPVLAVDVPSGLDCETGRPLGPTVRARHTATFVARKRGFEAPDSRPFTGKVHVVDIT